jgi:16S rRNA (guanine527-N7)-methyltransferase
MTQERTQLVKELEAGLDWQSIQLSNLQIEQLIDYIDLLAKWNKVYNLTSITDKSQMIILHLLDSLSILSQINKISSQLNYPLTIADVGTGGGLPGIPLAICLPDVTFTLLDARDKKIRFLQQVVSQLKLGNVQPIHSRVEKYIPQSQFDIVITRAFSSIKDMLGICSHLCHTNGSFLAMKGKEPLAEINQLPDEFEMLSMEVLKVYKLDALRHLIILQQKVIQA